jgi:hypothetical protein
MVKDLHQDVIAGSVIALVSVSLYLQTFDFAAGSALWPRIILWLLVLLAIWIVFKGLQKTKRLRQGETGAYYEGEDEEERLNLQLLKSPIGTFLGVVAYVVLLIVIGFFPATILFLAGYLWYEGVRNWVTYALTIVGLNVFVYLLFVLQLNVPLPPGLFLQ